MKYTTYLSLMAACAGVAQAHSRVFGLWVNGQFQGEGAGKYLRQPRNNSPVKDVESADINCNVDNRAAPSSVSVKAGDKIDFEWFHNTRNDDIIDLSHLGPITVYIADAASNGNGAVWTKIAEEGFSNGKWAVENLVANGGKHSVTLPSSLAAGDYLLRAEIIAHHESDTDFKVNSARGAQFYPSCSQIKVTSGGSAKPNQNFNFVGGYKSNAPGILFNLYSANPNTYTIPGPPVWNGATGGSSPVQPPAQPAPSTTSRAPAPTQAPVNPPANGGAATVTVTATVTATTTVQAACATGGAPAPGGNVVATAAKFQQCGGRGFNGPTRCASGSSCRVMNDYYSQCL